MPTTKINSALLLLLIIVHLFCLSCSPKKSNEVVIQSDSISQDVQAITHQVDLDSLSQLKRYFERKGTSIPLPLCGKYLDTDDFEQLYSGCYSYEMMERENLTFFIVRLKCMAGGTCKEKHLLIFDKDGFKSELGVGMDISDQSFRKRIEYKFASDHLIELKINNQEFKNDKLVSDTTFFEYYSIDSAGLIKQTDKP